MLKRKFSKFLPLLKRILIALVIVLLFYGGIRAYNWLNYQKLLPQTWWQIATNQTTILKQNNGRTNILLLGVGGKNHEGGDMTDTIMVVSVDFAKKDLVLITIPRDIWISSFKDKINAAYKLGEEKQVGGGFILSKAAVEEVTGLPVHYGVMIDFSGFVKLVDVVNNIDVTVAETFTDNMYPIPGRENDLCSGDKEYKCRYESVTFTKGIEYMDGERALKYVRSRFAIGNAGTDFSRGLRQITVINSLKNKILSNSIIFNPNKSLSLIQIMQQSLVTDMRLGEELVLVRSFEAAKPNIRSYNIPWDRPELKQVGLLVNPSQYQYNNLWVLIPKHNNFDQIKKYLSCTIDSQKNCEKLFE